MLVLTTWGRKSQQPRHTMLSYVSVGYKVVVCSGWGKKSDWLKNLLVDPLVTLHIGKQVSSRIARRVVDRDEFQQVVDEMFETGGDSHFEPWLASFGINPDPQDMMEKRDRLHLITFDETDEAGPPAMPVDLRWVWGTLFLFLILVWILIVG